MVQAQAALAKVLCISATETRIEARMLLCRALGDVPRAWLIAHEDDAVHPAQQLAFEALLQRRLSGEPIAYLLGEREFFGLMFNVTPATLIPRPETELLVELALQRCGRVAASPPGAHRPPPCGGVPPMHPSPQPSGETPSHSTRPSKNNDQVAGYSACGRGGLFRVLDLGTGSGAIALSIAHERPVATVLACDASQAALDIARKNAQRLGVANVAFMQSDWYAALDAQRFDLIVSNPPYVAIGDPHLQQGDLRFEPASALASGPDGLEDIRRIVAEAPAHLQPGGWLLLEHGYDQAAPVRELLLQAGLVEVFSARDLSGIERVSGGQAKHLF
jgi:release factor glutamine methyltransferase